MRNRVFAALAVIFIAGGLSIVSAQTTTRIKKATEVTPSWTYKGQWYGFLTCNKLQRQGSKVTPDQVKQCVAGGGSYILSGGGRTDLDCQGKCDAYAAQEVLVTGTMTSARYGTGPTSDEAVEGLYSGGDRPATKFEGVKILSVKVMPKANTGPDADFSSRVSDAAQK